jgi:predicted Zn-dependent protease
MNSYANQNCFEANKSQFDALWTHSVQDKLSAFAVANHISIEPNSIQLEIATVWKESVFQQSDDFATYMISLVGTLKTTDGTDFVVFTGDYNDVVPSELTPLDGISFRPISSGASYDKLGKVISVGHCKMESFQKRFYNKRILIANARSGKIIGSILASSVVLY